MPDRALDQAPALRKELGLAPSSYSKKRIKSFVKTKKEKRTHQAKERKNSVN